MDFCWYFLYNLLISCLRDLASRDWWHDLTFCFIYLPRVYDSVDTYMTHVILQKGVHNVLTISSIQTLVN